MVGGCTQGDAGLSARCPGCSSPAAAGSRQPAHRRSALRVLETNSPQNPVATDLSTYLPRGRQQQVSGKQQAKAPGAEQQPLLRGGGRGRCRCSATVQAVAVVAGAGPTHHAPHPTAASCRPHHAPQSTAASCDRTGAQHPTAASSAWMRRGQHGHAYGSTGPWNGSIWCIRGRQAKQIATLIAPAGLCIPASRSATPPLLPPPLPQLHRGSCMRSSFA